MTRPSHVFGYENGLDQLALSADGSILAISSMGERSDSTGIDGDEYNVDAIAAGAAYIYVRQENSTNLERQAYIKASNAEQLDQFGIGMAMSDDGKTLLVGALGESSAASGFDGDQSNNDLHFSGAVYHFEHTQDGWVQQHYIKAPQAFEDARFGYSVALSADGRVAAIGAQRDPAQSADGDPTGSVYIIVRTGDGWEYQQILKAEFQGYRDDFGYDVALSADGTTLAVGAPQDDSVATGIDGDGSDDTLEYSGAAYIFTEQNDEWTQQAYIKPSHTGEWDSFGERVTLSADGNTLAVGAAGEDSAALGLNGDQSDNNMDRAGAAYLFRRDENGSWQQQSYLKSSNPDEQGFFADSIALSPDGKTLAVGAPRESEDEGAVHLF